MRRTFKTKAEANRFASWVQTQHHQGKEWNPRLRDSRRLSQLIETWHRLHGAQLKDGDGRRRILLAFSHALGNPFAAELTAKHFTDYRAARLEVGITPNTVNHEQAYIVSLFNELRRLGEWNNSNPLTGVRQLRIQERELSWLTQEQIDALFNAMRCVRNPHVVRVTKLCLATGARWSEAEKLTAERLYRDRVVYADTKGFKVRTVPIAPELAEELRTRPEGRLFQSCYMAFRAAVKRAGIKLPRGQCAHILRHTFASHFVMNGGNILILQRILGHSDIRITMRYAHLAPEHLEEARMLNPLANRKAAAGQ
ncbi:MAG TPA: tyrosine-type recombinase/integrase [Nitrococcus sp.]|nr:tyrosine-type recombinase/integrase [Nitrococcus sp.]